MAAPVLFSVVIPTYQRAETLPCAIESVLGQEGPSFEVIVVDDGSTDETPEVLAGFDDPRLVVLRTENRGRTAARNEGARRARGEFLAFLDSDDFALPGWLQALGRAAAGDEVAVVCCGIRVVRGDKISTRVPTRLSPLYGGIRGLFLTGSFALRRELFLSLGGYDEQLAYAENTDLALRLTAEAKRQNWVVASTDCLGIQWNPAPVETRRNPRERLESAARMLERHGRRYLAEAPRSFATYAAIAGVSAARLGDFRSARRFFWRALRVEPRSWTHYRRLAVAWLPWLGRRVWQGEARS